MNKKELISAVAETTELNKKDVEQALNGIIGVIADELVTGGRVQLTGFGTFEVRDRKERQGRNMQTGEPVYIPASKAPVFKAGKTLKDYVNGR